VRQARATYNARDSKEGQEAHRLEEADRRMRRSGAFVGDHRCHMKSGELRVLPSAAPYAGSELLNASAVSPSSIEAPEWREGVLASGLKWLLVAWPELLAAADRRQGDEASCPFCGRQGRVVEVISIEQWRSSPRRGFGQEP